MQGNQKIQPVGWVTNIGNEYGAILQCILTSSESNESLKMLGNGLMNRFKEAKVDPPRVLYSDSDDFKNVVSDIGGICWYGVVLNAGMVLY